jgi:hypothetical protein
MRTAFIKYDETETKITTLEQVEEFCPWAAEIVEVDVAGCALRA